MKKIFFLCCLVAASLSFAQSPLTADGAINALFSTSDTTQVFFSRGNLQFNAAQGTHACADGTIQAGMWRFATEQYEVRLSENANRSASYDGWIDLFTYGASGYNGQMPYNSSSELTKEKMSEMGKIAGTYHDFGTYNAIENGGNTPGIWHMFTLREWNYLVNTRANASSLRGHAKIDNIQGIILLPDNCDFTALHQIASFATGDNAMNNYSLSVWQQIETLGAVFLPSGGRYETFIINANDGNYMASFSPYMNAIDGVYFTDNTISTATFPQAALSVRLVKDAPTIYYLHATPNNEAWGYISGDTIYFGEDITISATPNEGYHFVQWSDGVTDNPRNFTLTGDSTIIAEFAPNTYTLNFSCDEEQGAIEGESGNFGYLSEHTLTAVANYGYTFAQWSDGVKDNPRMLILTRDTNLIALFTINHYPVVLLGHDGKLLSKQTVDYNHAAAVPEVPARDGYTFSGWTTDIEHIIDTTYAIALYDKNGGTVIYKAEDGEVIGSENVDLHLPLAPSIEGKTFAGWLTESADSENGIVLRATYTLDNPTANDDVTVVPSSTTAEVNFPYVTGAVTYILVIRDLFGHIVCKIMFNANGQLLGIAFAPGRNQQQSQQTSGFSFTVEGLDPSTTYEYEFVAHDETDDVIETLTGSFTTAAETPTDTQSTEASSQSPIKIVQDNHVYILRGDQINTITGQPVKLAPTNQ